MNAVCRSGRAGDPALVAGAEGPPGGLTLPEERPTPSGSGEGWSVVQEGLTLEGLTLPLPTDPPRRGGLVCSLLPTPYSPQYICFNAVYICMYM